MSQPPSPTDLMDEDELRRLRSEFPILSRKRYLNSCSLGALPTRGEEALRRFAEEWHEKGASAWYDAWLPAAEELRERVARFLGATPAELALLPTTSSALSVLGESVDYGRRNRVVVTELDFPTQIYQWAVKSEVELVVLESPDGVRIHPEQFEEAVDDRTAFLATSHVFFTTGHRQDLGVLADIAHRAGAFCLIDGYQGAGQVPVDLAESGVDAYTAGPLKWLCGGPGLAYLYVRRERIAHLHPRITSWFAHERPFDFDPHHFAFRTDARRFELGTPAVPTIRTALAAQKLLDPVGMEAIAARNRHLTRRLVTGLEERGFRPNISPEPERRTAIVLVAHDEPARAVEILDGEGIVVDHRPGHVRVSPHFYNTEEEVDTFVEALDRVRAQPRP